MTRMMYKSQRKTPIKFVLYSGHDSTLTPFLLFMGLFEDEWIQYATRLVFELWSSDTLDQSRSAAIPLRHFLVRVLLNGKAVTHKVNFCRDKLLYREFCPADELLKVLSKTGPNGMEDYYKTLCTGA